VNRFEQRLVEDGLVLRRARLATLQINVGRKCNQACRHCHVDAAPWRTEMIDETTGPSRRRLDFAVSSVDRGHHRGRAGVERVFSILVETATVAGAEVIDRNNLTIIEEPGYGWLPEYLAEHRVQVIASLPCYSAGER